MGIDATMPLAAPEMRFKRIRVPGEEAVDLAAVIDPRPWRDAIG